MYIDYARMAADVRSVRARMADIRASAQSADGLISVTVDGSGELLELRLDARIYRVADAAALGEDIADTVREAARRAQDEGRVSVQRLLSGED